MTAPAAMTQQLHWLSDTRVEFPPIEQALDDPPGLLAIGGDLQPERLLKAYAEGIFPWFEPGSPILWWSPDPRMILRPEAVHVSRSLQRTLRRGGFDITMDRDFAQVITLCADLRRFREGTWITPEMGRAYQRLHERGDAHSIEVWMDGELVGGLYGVAMGPLFFGESMFSRRSNGSRIALVALSRQLQQWGFRLIDCQMPSEHLARMGAEIMPRRTFKQLLLENRDRPGREGRWQFDPGPDWFERRSTTPFSGNRK